MKRGALAAQGAIPFTVTCWVPSQLLLEQSLGLLYSFLVCNSYENGKILCSNSLGKSICRD